MNQFPISTQIRSRAQRALWAAALFLTLGTPAALRAQVAAEPPAPAGDPPGEPSPVEAKSSVPPASEPPPPAATIEIAAPAPVPSSAEPAAEEEEPAGWVKVGGYVEAYYSVNFAKPENNITNNRWLDEKHNTFTLQTVALDIAAERGPFSAKVTLMFGPTADRWYFEGVRVPETETGVVLSPAGYNNETWKHVQIAYAGYKAPLGEGLLLQGGLFATQVGYEGAAVKDNWNWSRSNLFNFLPFFHVGARVGYPLTEKLTLTAAIYNGWNQATDLNGGKTLSLQASYVSGKWLGNLLYLGGPERPQGDGSGQPWRNLFDAVGQFDVHPNLSLALHANAGWETSNFGDHAWAAGALYARAKATDWLYFAARGDGIYESVPEANPSSWILLGGSDHVLSATLTAELRPVGDGFSLRLEYRHDDSDKDVPLYYKRGFTNGLQNASATQDTFTIGLTGWF
jgi:Putative beta-barrel porin-2, OmpL-like. bbp2